MTPAERAQVIELARKHAIGRWRMGRRGGPSLLQFYHVIVATEYAGPMTAEEQALSDQAVAELGDVHWYHGGLPGRAVGDLLLPAKDTGSDPRGQTTVTPDRVTHVYISQEVKEARKFARWADGPLYEIEPIGPVEVDPTWLRFGMLMHDDTGGWWSPQWFPQLCRHWRCGSARVIGIADTAAGACPGGERSRGQRGS